MRIGIFNHKSSNIASLKSALDKIGVVPIISENFKNLMEQEKIIIPGVGSMKNFNNSEIVNLKDQIKLFASKGGYLYGICLGMQFFLSYSEESRTKNLNLIRGKTLSLKKRFKLDMNVGYRNILFKDNSKILKKLFNGINIKYDKFYFLHKYFCTIGIKKNFDIIEVDFFKKKIVAGFYYKNILGTQFHPELSKNAGLKFLKNFCYNL